MRRPRDLRRRYGLSGVDYQRLLDAQDGVCAICKRPPPEGRFLGVDHDHKTDAIRGLLCDRCNLALGQFYDSLSNLSNAMIYLEEHKMSHWTEDELAALRTTTTFHEWGAMTGYSKSYDGWESKRRRLAPPADVVDLAGDAEYVDVTTAVGPPYDLDALQSLRVPLFPGAEIVVTLRIPGTR